MESSLLGLGGCSCGCRASTQSTRLTGEAPLCALMWPLVGPFTWRPKEAMGIVTAHECVSRLAGLLGDAQQKQEAWGLLDSL
ncbi:hypothetical protein NDU88_004267 [Pleurodeles waltl]|uniref:Uncharacterized protein n=1 Tax=Pleurodeles waltl TaxID=8319 RepID=A0AAV7V1C3_PLEWA|nr:hypothetical protein NDU88_004267 [Pleurodeles waltl]